VGSELGKNVKVKSALKNSISNAKVIGVIFPIVLILTAMFPNAIMFIISGVTAFTFAGDRINIVYIKRKAAKRPGYLEDKID